MSLALRLGEMDAVLVDGLLPSRRDTDDNDGGGRGEAVFDADWSMSLCTLEVDVFSNSADTKDSSLSDGDAADA